MVHRSLRPKLLLLLALSLVALGCGSSRDLKSVAISPAAANAKDFPNGQVAFTATGTFSKPPSPEKLTGMDVSWCVGDSQGRCVGNINPGITVDSNGIASCVSTFSGTATVLAGKTKSVMMPDGGSQMGVFGSAQLTCP
jgi:hypothetical protein